MRTLQKIISRYMYQLAGILVVVILTIVFCIEVINERELACESAMRTFLQMEQVLEENQKELEDIQEEYKQTCLHNAEVIARLIESDPDVVDSVRELRDIAASVEVDEIHIFDNTGCIVAGTHPQYYNYTFDSGEQMMFFKPMLEDKSLKLVQDIMPNTAEGKQMQYSALWSNNGEFIVQVGMEPVNVIKVTKKNELSYIFSLFCVNPDINYYAIDAESGEIVGSAAPESVGSNITEIGLGFEDIARGETTGFNAVIHGQHSFCVFKKIGSNYIGRVVSSRRLYRRIPAIMLMVFICLMASALFLAKAVIRYMNKYVVDEIHNVNKKLKAIANGGMDEVVDIQNSVEFAELSKYINGMVKSLLDNNKRMAYVLNKTNLYIGVYEYNKYMGKIHFTDYIPKLFSLEVEKMEELSSNIEEFREFINKIRKNPISDETGVYKVGERYIRLEEIKDEDGSFGVVVDATSEIVKRRKIEEERDIDLLTGLYNRRGLDTQLAELFCRPEKLGYYGMIMIDADGLKEINDTYGHEMGDIYLKELAGQLHDFGAKNSIAARQGGDEFVLFLYDYENEEMLRKTIEKLADLQIHSYVQLKENLQIPLRFSYGYCMAKEEIDYQELLKKADKMMYKNKMERKKNI